MSFTVEETKIIEHALSILAKTLSNSNHAFTSSPVTRDYLRLRLAAYEREVFLVLYLNSQHVLIDEEELFYGTIDGSMVHPREVLKSALKKNAAAVIVAHNHPSGIADPSSGDIGITRKLKEALDVVEIRLLDHIVVGAENTTSLAEKGLM